MLDKYFTSIQNGITVQHVQFYQPNAIGSFKSEMTFFIADETIDKKALLEYKKVTETELLIALSVDNQPYSCLEIADNILVCKPNEVKMILENFNDFFTYTGFTGMDFNDIKNGFGRRTVLNFAQTYCKGKQNIEKTLTSLLESQIDTFRFLFFTMIMSPDFGLEEYEIITTTTRNMNKCDDADIFYQILFDEEDYYAEEGFWFGLCYVSENATKF